MSAAAIYTLAGGGWLIALPDGQRVYISPLPVQCGDGPRAFARTLRDWAYDIERAAGAEVKS